MPVVYNGTPGTSHGDLFQGLKLWVAQRVPQRARWVDLVKGNGGEVVRLEKTADMLIADNIKVAGVSPPPGSYMWRWIDDSVKNGFLQDKDDYLIGRREGSSREPGAAEQTRAGRIAFTRNDDLILTRWVIAEERMGNAISGNATYKPLERRHPHHTWQSWRDRWVKTLRSRPRPEFSEVEIQAEINQHRAQSPEAAPGPAGSSRRVQPIQAAQIQPQSTNAQNGPATPPSRAPRPAAPVSSGRAQGLKGRTFFTEDEDRLLLEYIEAIRQRNRADCSDENKNLGGNVIYKDLAMKHPTHTWHSWRDRWVRHLSLREAVDDAGPDEASNASPEEAPNFGKRRPQQLRASGGGEQSARVETAGTGPGLSSAQQQADPKSDEQRLRRKQRERRETRAALLIERTWRGHAVRRDMARLEAAVVPLQALMRGYVARMRTARLVKARDLGSEPGEGNSSQGSEQYQDAEEALANDRDPREQFYDDLQVIMGTLDLRVDSEPSINGHRIDLWDLYRLARQQGRELDSRDWKLVTEGLGFQPVNRFVWKVQACYYDNLAEFEHHIKTFESNDDIGGENMEEVQEQETGRDTAAEIFQPTSEAVTAPKQPVANPSSPAYRSSPPVVGSKRSLERTDLLRYGSGFPSSEPRKRRRVDRNSVIPATPDEKIGLSKGSLDRIAIEIDSSPLKSKALADDGAVEIISEDESELPDEVMASIEELDELPTQSGPPRKKYIEPETQDWHIPQDPFSLDDVADVSPSQQLHLESDAVKSPDQPVQNNRHTAAAKVKSFQHPSTRTMRSSPKEAVVPTPLTSSSRAPVNGKITKRTLPNSYQRKVASTAAATSLASAPNGSPIFQSRPQPNGTTKAVPPSTAPVRTANGSALWHSHVNAYTPMPAMRPSTNHSPASSLPIPTQLVVKKDAPTLPESGELDEACVEAQFSHFQALGYKKEDIARAMEAATMSRGPMVVALRSLARGQGLPQDEPGVWTPRDCNDLRRIKKYELQMEKGKGVAASADGKMKVMLWNLEKKHGKARIEERWQFMNIQGMSQGR